MRLIFIHHSTGEGWLADDQGGLGLALRDSNYFVSDTNYGWGPDGIGDTTDIGHWFTWFRSPNSSTYLNALYAEGEQNSEYSRLTKNPGGENKIILFKSCFPNSQLGGKPNDPPVTGDNPLRGQEASSEHMTVANAKGLYNDLLQYFAARQDKLFVVVTAPPLTAQDSSPANAANARALNNWLVKEWLSSYPHKNVFVFDFYNVLTSNGGTQREGPTTWAKSAAITIAFGKAPCSTSKRRATIFRPMPARPTTVTRPERAAKKPLVSLSRCSTSLSIAGWARAAVCVEGKSYQEKITGT